MRLPGLLRHLSAPSQLAYFELSFLDLICQFDTADHNVGCLETLQSQHRPQPLLDPSVILLDPVVQGLAAPHYHALRQFAAIFQICQRAMGKSATARWDAAYASRVTLAGTRCPFIALRKNALAALVSRSRLKKKSTVLPALSTARYR